jgi:type III secretory pathway component EscV
VEGTKAGAQGCGDEKKKKRMSTQMMLLSRVEHARSLMASRSGSLCDVLFLFFGGFPVSSLRLLCFFFFFRLVFSFAAKEAVDSPDMQNAQKKKEKSVKNTKARQKRKTKRDA